MYAVRQSDVGRLRRHVRPHVRHIQDDAHLFQVDAFAAAVRARYDLDAAVRSSGAEVVALEVGDHQLHQGVATSGYFVRVVAVQLGADEVLLRGHPGHRQEAVNYVIAVFYQLSSDILISITSRSWPSF